MGISEKQRYSPYVNWGLVILTLGYIFWVGIRPLFQPGFSIGLYIVYLISSLIPIGITVFMFLSKVEVTVDNTGVRYRYWPVNRNYQYVPWGAVKYVYVRRVEPLKEYGGWGLKYSSSKGQGVILSGNYGLQLHLVNGDAILVGVKNTKKLIIYLDMLLENGSIGKDQLPPSSAPVS